MDTIENKSKKITLVFDVTDCLMCRKEKNKYYHQCYED